MCFWIILIYFFTALFCHSTNPSCQPDQAKAESVFVFQPTLIPGFWCLDNRDFGSSLLHTDAVPQTVMSSCLQPDSGRQRLLHPLTQGGQLAVGRTCPVALPGEDQEGWGPGPDLDSAQALLMEWRLGCPYGTCE